MDRSYRVKMEQNLESHILLQEYIINCIVKCNRSVDKLAYKEKKYRGSWFNEYLFEEAPEKLLEKGIEYRKPFIDVLRKHGLSVEEIKRLLENAVEKNIPTQKVCDQIRNILLSGNYKVVQ